MSSRAWTTDAALAALTIAAIAFSGWVVGRDVEPSADGPVVVTPPTLEPADEVETATTEPTPVTDVLVLGDETVRGARSAGRWIVDLEGAGEVDNRSRPLSGYVTDGPTPECGLPSCPMLPRMLEQVPETADPGLVIVSAGAHDVDTEATVLRQAISSFFASVTERFPTARIVVISPIVRDGEVPTGLDTVRRVVATVAEQDGLDLVDVGQPYLKATGITEAERIASAGDALAAAVGDASAGR